VSVILFGPMLVWMCYWAFGDGRGSRLAAGRTPRAGAAAPAASGSRSWCRRRGGRAQRWRPPHRWWPGRRQAAPRSAPASPRSAQFRAVPSPHRRRLPNACLVEDRHSYLSRRDRPTDGPHRWPHHNGEQRTITFIGGRPLRRVRSVQPTSAHARRTPNSLAHGKVASGKCMVSS
jgi:hypothetical protein